MGHDIAQEKNFEDEWCFRATLYRSIQRDKKGLTGSEPVLVKPEDASPSRSEGSRFYMCQFDEAMKMKSNDSSRRDELSFCAIDPVSGQIVRYQMKHSQLLRQINCGLGAIKESKELVEFILRNPLVIFQGLLNDDEDDYKSPGWLCYCGIPPYACLTDKVTIDPPVGKVYLVFVNEERVIYKWGWEVADREDEHRPRGANKRFVSKIYGQ